MKAVKTTSWFIRFVIATTAFSLMASGCATIVKGTRQEVVLSSQPPGASVFVNNVSEGQTPTVIKLKRNSRYVVLLELAGYAPYEIHLGRKLNNWVFGNILLGGIIGLGVDAISGALYKLTPEEVNAVLVAQGPATPVNPTMPMYPPQPDSTNAETPGGKATVTPQQVVPAPAEPDSTKVEEDDENEADSTGAEGEQLEASLEDGKLYLFVVMEADPTWEKVGQLERVTE